MKLIIEGYDKSIHKKDNQIVIKEQHKLKDNILAEKITDITILGKGYITFDALQLIADYNIKLISMDYHGNIEYILESPVDQDNIKLRKKQYHASENNDSIIISKEIIKSKLLNQKYTLKTLNKTRKIDSITEDITKLNTYIEQLENLTPTYSITKTKTQILGIEGKASTKYWNSIKTILPPSVNFEKRTKKPAKDLVNAMLNYGYAILASEITKNITLSGLDTYCGFLHFDLNNRKSLTYDIIEEFRQQIVDKAVLTLINTKQVTTNDYDQTSNMLTLDARKLIISNIMNKINSQIIYKKEKTTYANIIEKQVKGIKNYLIKGTPYAGFYLRW